MGCSPMSLFLLYEKLSSLSTSPRSLIKSRRLFSIFKKENKETGKMEIKVYIPHVNSRVGILASLTDLTKALAMCKYMYSKDNILEFVPVAEDKLILSNDLSLGKGKISINKNNDSKLASLHNYIHAIVEFAIGNNKKRKFKSNFSKHNDRQAAHSMNKLVEPKLRGLVLGKRNLGTLSKEIRTNLRPSLPQYINKPADD